MDGLDEAPDTTISWPFYLILGQYRHQEPPCGFDDDMQHFGKLRYIAPETAHDFPKYSSILDGRLRSCILTKRQVKKNPWWKLG